MRTALILASIVLLSIGGAGVGLAQSGELDAQGSPDIEVYIPNNEVTPGSETELTVQFDNDGEFIRGNEADRAYVTTARSVVTSLDADDTPITVKTGEKSIGELPESTPKEVTFNVEIPDDAEIGSHEIDVDFEYSYTSKVENAPGLRPSQTSQSRSKSKEIKIKITDDARFRVTEIDSTLRVGEDGDITGEIENVGGEDATNAEVQFPTEAENLFPQETAVAVGDIEAGESAEFRIPIEVGSEAEAVPNASTSQCHSATKTASARPTTIPRSSRISPPSATHSPSKPPTVRSPPAAVPPLISPSPTTATRR